MRFRIEYLKRDRFRVVGPNNVPVMEDPEYSDKSIIFDDIDDAMELRDRLNDEIRIRIENLEQ
jgi:hypothetical protein